MLMNASLVAFLWSGVHHFRDWMMFYIPSTDTLLWHTVDTVCVSLSQTGLWECKCAEYMSIAGLLLWYPWQRQSHGFISHGSWYTANSLNWAALRWICVNWQNETIQRFVLIGMVYNSRQLLYIQKSHNTGKTGCLVYICPWSNANFSSEGLLSHFGGFSTYTRNEILAKNAYLLATCYKKVLWFLTVKWWGKLLKSSRKWPGTLETMAHRVPMIPPNSVSTIWYLGGMVVLKCLQTHLRSSFGAHTRMFAVKQLKKVWDTCDMKRKVTKSNCLT